MRQHNTNVMDGPPEAPSDPVGFEAFVLASEPPLRRALVAAYGYEAGMEAAAGALARAWEHWPRVRQMPNAAENPSALHLRSEDLYDI